MDQGVVATVPTTVAAVRRTARFGIPILVGYVAMLLAGTALGLLDVVLSPLLIGWVVLTVDVPAVIALRRDEAAGVAWTDPARAGPPRPLAAWLIVGGLSMAVGTVGLALYAKDTWGSDAARSMAIVTLSLFHLWWALETVLPRRSLLSPQLRDHRMVLLVSLGSLVVLVAGVVAASLAGVPGIGRLGLDQWLACLVVSLTIVLLAEAKKAMGLLLRGEAEAPRPREVMPA
jgi:magnesium-transporting ATPase (P-type)